MVDITGPSQSVPKERRFAADVCDLVTIPIYLGSVFGVVLMVIPESVRNILLILLNIAWLLFRDTVFAPGRSATWRKNLNISGIVIGGVGVLLSLISKAPAAVTLALAFWLAVSIIALLIDKAALPSPNLKLVSLTGDKVTVTQAFLRNVLLSIPFVLMVGYLVEIIFVFTKGDRLSDSWAKTRVIAA